MDIHSFFSFADAQFIGNAQGVRSSRCAVTGLSAGPVFGTVVLAWPPHLSSRTRSGPSPVRLAHLPPYSEGS
jgi:hypothetical protein